MSLRHPLLEGDNIVDVPPPGRMRQPIGGAWCGRWGHPPRIFRARDGDELERILVRFECPECRPRRRR